MASPDRHLILVTVTQRLQERVQAALDEELGEYELTTRERWNCAGTVITMLLAKHLVNMPQENRPVFLREAFVPLVLEGAAALTLKETTH